MKKLLLLALAVLCPAAVSAQAITAVTAPATNTTIKAANEFATRAFQDPWDMSQKTDVGPFLGSNDVGSSNWAPGFKFTVGLFSGTTTAGDAQLWLLDTGNPNAAPIGRTGTNFPIDSSVYKTVAVRMTRPAGAAATQAQVLTWPKTIYDSSATAHFSGTLFGGTGVYFIDLDRLQPTGAAGSGNWTGLQRALRFQPTGSAGEAISVDWIRLVSQGDATSCQPINWNGGTGADKAADIYIDTDNNFANGFYGLVQGFATPTALGVGTRASAGCPVIGGAFNFNVGALPAGTYYIFVAPLNTTPTAGNVKYSPGAWTVTDIPTLKFISPTDEGSDDDFAGSQLGDAWNFDKLADVDTLFNINNPSITTLNMEAPSGASLPNQRVFQGTSAFATGGCNAIGDPVMVMLDFAKRGKNALIDANRYRLLTVEFGIPNAPRDVNCGSIARVVWHKKGDDVNSGYSVSDDLIFNQRAGVNLLDKLTVDLKTLLIEQGVGAPNTDWNNGPGGGIDFFRFDPHEFGPATTFYVKRIKLADFERAKNTYTIRWTYTGPPGTVDLYYDMDAGGFDGTPITSGLASSAGQFTWDIPGNLPTSGGGTPVYIYAIFRDTSIANGNSNQVYAPLPIYADADYKDRPRAVVNRTSLNFGVLGNTSNTTSPQTVRLTFVGPATQTPCWTITNTNLNFQVTPSSGTGNANLSVSMVSQIWPGGGVGNATFTINEGASCPGTMLNPGMQFMATYRTSSGLSVPMGAVDTPADLITGVTGSLGITGWVVDEVDITGVKIYRKALPGEPGDGLGRIFLGTASRVDDARPDIEAANPTAPFNYRGGWGYLLLTNFLPNTGNGTFTIMVFASDPQGHETLLGQRTISVTNSTATDPFGAIDTPDQGAAVTGLLNNFGWVLIRGTAHADPPHGGTVTVFVDGVGIGSPGQWTSRDDLSTLFPKAQYDGVDSALGVFPFNTALYADGVHTISWLVFANTGTAAGIGSRYFTTVNGNSSLTLSDSIASVNLGRPATAIAALDGASQVKVNRSGSLKPTFGVSPDPTGLRTVFTPALDRVVVDASLPGAHAYEAYQVAGGVLRALPIGASFDGRRGVLAWQPGVGFIGSYDFVVIRDGRERVPLRVVLTPEGRRAPVSKFVRGLFAAD